MMNNQFFVPSTDEIMNLKKIFVADFLAQINDVSKALGHPSDSNVLIEKDGKMKIFFSEDLNENRLLEFWESFVLSYYSSLSRRIGDAERKMSVLASDMRLLYENTQLQMSKSQLNLQSIQNLLNVPLEEIKRCDLLEEYNTKQAEAYVFFNQKNAEFAKMKAQLDEKLFSVQCMRWVLRNRLFIKSVTKTNNPYRAYHLEVAQKAA